MVAASSTNVVLGPSRAVCGRFASGRLRLVLRNYRVVSLETLAGAEWADRAGHALGEVGNARGWRGRVAVALPLTAVFHMRVGQLPAAAGARRVRLAQQAQDASGLPLSELTWAAQPVGDPASREAIMAVARSSEVALLHTRGVAAGARGVCFMSAGFALWRAFVHNYPEQVAPAVFAAVEPEGLHLLFVDGPRWQLRALRWSTAGDDVLALAELELKRALALHRHQGELRVPEVLFWAAHQRTDDEALNRLAQVLALRVDRFDPFRRVGRSPDLVLDDDLVAQGKLVGLALLRHAREVQKLDLCPAHLKREERQRVLRRVGVALFVAVVAGLCFGAGVLRHQAAVEANAARAAHERLAMARAKARQADLDRARLADLRSELAVLSHVVSARRGWAELLADLERRLAVVGDVWLDELHYQSGTADLQEGKGARLVIKGVFLGAQGARSSSDTSTRARALVGQLAQSAGVVSVCEEHFDEDEPGLVRFGCTLVLKGAP